MQAQMALRANGPKEQPKYRSKCPLYRLLLFFAGFILLVIFSLFCCYIYVALNNSPHYKCQHVITSCIEALIIFALCAFAYLAQMDFN